MHTLDHFKWHLLKDHMKESNAESLLGSANVQCPEWDAIKHNYWKGATCTSVNDAMRLQQAVNYEGIETAIVKQKTAGKNSIKQQKEKKRKHFLHHGQNI